VSRSNERFRSKRGEALSHVAPAPLDDKGARGTGKGMGGVMRLKVAAWLSRR